MTTVCIANCVNDARDARLPVRATYVNLYKWPESDAEFIKSVRRVGQGLQQHPRPGVVDSISCRQMYLRSYTFSRKESVPERTMKCFDRVKEKVVSNSNNHGNNNNNKKKKKKTTKQEASNQGTRKSRCLVLEKVKEMSCSALFRIFHRFLSCGASVDVVDRKD